MQKFGKTVNKEVYRNRPAFVGSFKYYVEKPPIFKQEGYTLIDMEVNIMAKAMEQEVGGIVVSSAAQIVKVCEYYEGNVFLQKYDKYLGRLSEFISCKDILDLMMINAERGARIRISVEGEDIKAEILV